MRDEGDDVHLPATDGAQQREQLLDASNQHCPQVVRRALGRHRLGRLGLGWECAAHPKCAHAHGRAGWFGLHLRCIDILKAHRLAGRTLDEYAIGMAGETTVGLMMPALTRCQLPPALLAFTAELPNVSVQVVEPYSHVLTETVRAGEFDFAIVPGTPNVLKGLRESPFVRTQECLVSSMDSPFAHLSQVSPAELHGVKLVLPGLSNAQREALNKYIAVHGIEVNRRLELDATLGNLGLVMSSDWRAIFPAIMVASDTAGQNRLFNVSPLGEPSLFVDLMLIEPQQTPLSASALAFLKALEILAGGGADHDCIPI